MLSTVFISPQNEVFDKLPTFWKDSSGMTFVGLTSQNCSLAGWAVSGVEIDSKDIMFVTSSQLEAGLEGKQDKIDSSNKLSYTFLSDIPTIPAKLSDLSDDSTHRLVADSEKATWNAKQDAISSNNKLAYSYISGAPAMFIIKGYCQSSELASKLAIADVGDVWLVDNAEYVCVSDNDNKRWERLGVLDTDINLEEYIEELSSSLNQSINQVNSKVDTLDIPTALSALSDDTTHRVVTDSEKAVWNAKSSFSGSYNDLTDKPNLAEKQDKIDSSHKIDFNLISGNIPQSEDSRLSSVSAVLQDSIDDLDTRVSSLENAGSGSTGSSSSDAPEFEYVFDNSLSAEQGHSYIWVNGFEGQDLDLSLKDGWNFNKDMPSHIQILLSKDTILTTDNIRTMVQISGGNMYNVELGNFAGAAYLMKKSDVDLPYSPDQDGLIPSVCGAFAFTEGSQVNEDTYTNFLMQEVTISIASSSIDITNMSDKYVAEYYVMLNVVSTIEANSLEYEGNGFDICTSDSVVQTIPNGATTWPAENLPIGQYFLKVSNAGDPIKNSIHENFHLVIMTQTTYLCKNLKMVNDNSIVLTDNMGSIFNSTIGNKSIVDAESLFCSVSMIGFNDRHMFYSNSGYKRSGLFCLDGRLYGYSWVGAYNSAAAGCSVMTGLIDDNVETRYWKFVSNNNGAQYTPQNMNSTNVYVDAVHIPGIVKTSTCEGAAILLSAKWYNNDNTPRKADYVYVDINPTSSDWDSSTNYFVKCIGMCGQHVDSGGGNKTGQVLYLDNLGRLWIYDYAGGGTRMSRFLPSVNGNASNFPQINSYNITTAAHDFTADIDFASQYPGGNSVGYQQNMLFSNYDLNYAAATFGVLLTKTNDLFVLTGKKQLVFVDQNVKEYPTFWKHTSAENQGRFVYLTTAGALKKAVWSSNTVNKTTTQIAISQLNSSFSTPIKHIYNGWTDWNSSYSTQQVFPIFCEDYSGNIWAVSTQIAVNLFNASTIESNAQILKIYLYANFQDQAYNAYSYSSDPTNSRMLIMYTTDNGVTKKVCVRVKDHWKKGIYILQSNVKEIFPPFVFANYTSTYETALGLPLSDDSGIFTSTVFVEE